MLILERRRGQRIFLYLEDGRRIEVTVVNAHGNSAHLGFDAPKEIRIVREELEKEGGNPFPNPNLKGMK